jgi:polyisoprenoid-binding protein YceI
MPTTSTAVQAPSVGRYAIEPTGSSVTFVTRHIFGLSKVRGRLEVIRSRLFLDVRRHPAISFCSDIIRQHRGGWSVTGVLTVKGHTAPVELRVDGALPRARSSSGPIAPSTAMRTASR